MKTLSIKLVLVFLSLLTVNSVLAQPKEIDLPEQSPAQRSVKLEELWRIGGEDDEDILLGIVNTGVLDEAGNTYLLDTQLTRILVIDSQGEQAGILSRKGEGPGELSRPIGLFLNGENQVAVVESFPGRIVLINLDDTPGGTIIMNGESGDGGFAMLTQARWRDGNLVANYGVGNFDTESGNFTLNLSLGLIDDDGTETARFASFSQQRSMFKQVFDEEADFSELGTWALGPDCVYTVPLRAEYRINKKNLDGELVTILRRPITPRKRTDQDKKELNATLKSALQSIMEIEERILDHDPAIAGLNVAADGRLFVQHSHQVPKLLPEDTAARFDIIDPDGRFREELSLELPGFNPKQDHLIFLDGVHFLQVRNIQGAVAGMLSGLMGTSLPMDESEEMGPLEIVFCRMAEHPSD